jgi:hypothetical protein
MDKMFEHLPAIISAAAQSFLGTFALLSVALSVLAYFFFAKAREKVRVGVFVLLFLGVFGFAAAMFRESAGASITSPPAASTAAAPLSKEAKLLLKGAAADPSGLVLFERFGTSDDLHTNGESFYTDKADHQALATWEAALEELVKAGLLVDRGDQHEIYEITKKGYEESKRDQARPDLNR